MTLTRKQQAACEVAARIIKTRGYEAFLEFIRNNKAEHERMLQAQLREDNRRFN